MLLSCYPIYSIQMATCYCCIYIQKARNVLCWWPHHGAAVIDAILFPIIIRESRTTAISTFLFISRISSMYPTTLHAKSSTAFTYTPPTSDYIISIFYLYIYNIFNVKYVVFNFLFYCYTYMTQYDIYFRTTATCWCCVRYLLRSCHHPRSA